MHSPIDSRSNYAMKFLMRSHKQYRVTTQMPLDTAQGSYTPAMLSPAVNIFAFTASEEEYFFMGKTPLTDISNITRILVLKTHT